MNDNEGLPRERHRARVRGVEPIVQAAAENLRKSETAAEQVLWQALRGRKVAGLKFRRQHAIGPYVLDFFCPEHKLVVEVDGGVHEGADAHEHDALRTEHIAYYGYRVLRFTNDDVLRRLPTVLDKIAQAAALTPWPPLPILGEGEMEGEGGSREPAPDPVTGTPSPNLGRGGRGVRAR